MGLSVDNALPAGVGPIPWALKNAPAGWLFCDGSVLLSGTPYQALRNALIADGFTYGQDGSGNPKLPDMKGRGTVGRDDMGGNAANRLTAAGSGVDGKTLGAAGGAETVTQTIAQQPSHAHPGSSVSIPSAFTNDGGQSLGVLGGPYYATYGVSVAAQGGGGAHNNMPPCLVTNYIIKG